MFLNYVLFIFLLATFTRITKTKDIVESPTLVVTPK